MPYDTALSKAWEELGGLVQKNEAAISFLADNYSINIEKRQVFSLACNVPAKDHLTIILLHYFIQSLKGLPALTGEWISFQELPGSIGYYPTFKKRVIERILRKYGKNPDGLLELVERFGAKRTQLADVSIAMEAFENIPLLINMWKGDSEFGPEANIHFDRNIAKIFCTEDIVVLSEIVAGQI